MNPGLWNCCFRIFDLANLSFKQTHLDYSEIWDLLRIGVMRIWRIHGKKKTLQFAAGTANANLLCLPPGRHTPECTAVAPKVLGCLEIVASDHHKRHPDPKSHLIFLNWSTPREESNCTLMYTHITEDWMDCAFTCGTDCQGQGRYPCLQVFVMLTHSGQKVFLHYSEEAVQTNSKVMETLGSVPTAQ